MAKKNVIWSKRANLELRKVLEFYIKRNGNTHHSFYILKTTEDLIESLAKNEYLGRLTNDKKARVLVLDVYLVFYEIHTTHIRILSFWDNRQNPDHRIDL